MELADSREVLDYLTRVLRGEESAGPQSGMKAAELLGKRYGLFNEREEELPAPVILDDIGSGDPG